MGCVEHWAKLIHRRKRDWADDIMNILTRTVLQKIEQNRLDELEFKNMLTSCKELRALNKLMDGLETAGFLIERSPLVNAGETVCTRCEMATVEQADALIAIGEIQCDILCFTTTLTFTQYAEVDKTRGTRTNRSSDRCVCPTPTRKISVARDVPQVNLTVS